MDLISIEWRYGLYETHKCILGFLQCARKYNQNKITSLALEYRFFVAFFLILLCFVIAILILLQIEKKN